MMRAFAFAALAAGCATHHSGPPDDTKATLSVDPPMSEVTIVNDTPAGEDFTATLHYPDGTTRDVTSETRFGVDESYGMFAQAHLTMNVAGKTTVIATWADKVSTAEVIARLKDTRVDPSLPPNVVGWFSNPDDPSHAPTVVYPPVGVIMPRNIGDFEVHWSDASTNDVYEISLVTEFTDVRVYVPGTKVSPPPLPGAAWMAFLASEWRSAVANEASVQMQVRGVSSANPTTVGSAPLQMIDLSNENMLGGLYYWTTTSQSGVSGIFRHDVSKPGQPAEQYMTSAQTGRCVGCHVLSRNGHEMAITYDGGNGVATMVDVATSTAAASQRGWNFGTFTPDGKQFLAVQNGTLTVLDYASQAPLATMTAATPISHPDLSPDGTRLVYVRDANNGADWSFSGGQLYVRSYDATTYTFGPEQPLVADSANSYYPSWSPDGQWILFNKDLGNANAYNNANAMLYVIKADGSAPAIPLAIMNSTQGLTNSWGRWAPFAQTLGSNNRQMYWITVSSKRDFGVRLVGVNKPQIWMAPFFPDRSNLAQDPSGVAFRLPFQNIESNNHIAQWTEQVVTQ